MKEILKYFQLTNVLFYDTMKKRFSQII